MKTIIPKVLDYFKSTPPASKIIDSLVLVFASIGVGMSLGKIPFHYSILVAPILIGAIAWGTYRYRQSQHSVENTCDLTSRVHRILTAEQYFHNFQFAGRFLFSNGTNSLDNSFNFMRLSLTEYVLPEGNSISPQRWTNLPILINLKLISALSDGETFQDEVSTSSAMWSELNRIEVKSYTAVPIRGNRGALIGFAFFGSSTSTPPDKKICEEITSKIEQVS